jgi:hypothetical protein
MTPKTHSLIETIQFGMLFFGGAVGLIVLGLWLYGRLKKPKDDAQ